ncbi:MAG TPA: hypothetical protein VKU82_07645 [Planctomycetaceae bacterium]|nr:hypothetical protein [Planctomycetaceae bacterium]
MFAWFCRESVRAGVCERRGFNALTSDYGKYLFMACIIAGFGTTKALSDLLQMKVILSRTC